MIKIIFIAGDGRSGSTLLDSVLSNIEGSISVGECHRFWVRYVENQSHCSCSKMMHDCELWSEVEKRLKQQFPAYEGSQFEKAARTIQFYKNYKKIPELLKTDDWVQFAEIVKAFYTAIASITGSNCIIDSSKSMPWAYVLQHLGIFDVRIIHLERNLVEVANSWKKTIRLPEYTDREVFMPKKGNMLIAKSWLKTKLMQGLLKWQNKYAFVNYRSLCKSPRVELERLALFVNEKIPFEHLKVMPNHAIGGNPMRSALAVLEIKNVPSNNKELTVFEKLFFNVIGLIAKLFYR